MEMTSFTQVKMRALTYTFRAIAAMLALRQPATTKKKLINFNKKAGLKILMHFTSYITEKQQD